jgi:hypothetical protein
MRMKLGRSISVGWSSIAMHALGIGNLTVSSGAAISFLPFL